MSAAKRGRRNGTISLAPSILRRAFARPRAALGAGLMLGLLAVLAAACSGGGDQAPGPRLSLDGDTFDLGEIRAGEAVQRLVEFRNDGDAPLTVAIVEVRPAPDTTCGCGVESFSVEQSQVAPGETGHLVFTLKVPEGTIEMKDAMLVDLQTNEPAKGQHTITIKYRVV